MNTLGPTPQELNSCGLPKPDIEFFCRGHAYLAFGRTGTGKAWLARFYPEITQAGYAVVVERLTGNLVVEAVGRGGLSVCVHP